MVQGQTGRLGHIVEFVEGEEGLVHKDPRGPNRDDYGVGYILNGSAVVFLVLP